MEEILTHLNCTAIIVGAVISFILGMLWYSPKLFGKKWMEGTGMTEAKAKKGGMILPMITQALATALFAWVIGIMMSIGYLWTAILIIITIAMFIEASGRWVMKSTYALKTETLYIIVMGIIMIAMHSLV